jgi:membrane protein
MKLITNTLCLIERLRQWALSLWHYLSVGVWRDTRDIFIVRALKTLNLSFRSVMDNNLQALACALTYRIFLALVPALALMFAIARGFGFQNLIQSELMDYFPAQRTAIETALTFVDSYLAQSSEGLFVGIGIVILLWTLISLVGAMEAAFNGIWCVKHGRTYWRKITDYTAMFLILPILMVCSSGLTAMVNTSITTYLPSMSTAVKVLLDVASVVVTWLFFTAIYILVPNVKVKFANAFIAGVVAGIAYQVLQALFVSGQIYVSKYNAVYGGFAFLPLLLVWMQLVWLTTLAGAVVCYSSQSISLYAFTNDVNSISTDYRRRVGVSVMAVVAQRYKQGLPPLTLNDMEQSFSIPLRLLSGLISDLEDVHLINRVIPEINKDTEIVAYQPAKDVSTITVGEVMQAFDTLGATDFVPDFNKNFATIDNCVRSIEEKAKANGSTLLLDLQLPNLGDIAKKSSKINIVSTN